MKRLSPMPPSYDTPWVTAADGAGADTGAGGVAPAGVRRSPPHRFPVPLPSRGRGPDWWPWPVPPQRDAHLPLDGEA